MSSIHHINVTPTQLIPHVQYCINKKISFFIHGSPGTGKSATLKQLCIDMNLKLQDERLSQYDAVDVRGLPDVDKDKNRTTWIPAEILPQETDPPGLILLDEFSDAADDVKKAAYQLVLDRQLGKYKVPDHWAIGAAGNLISDMSFVTRNPAALNNRFCHFYVEPEIQDWAAHAAQRNFHPMVIGFLLWKPIWLHAYTGMPRDELSTLIKNSDAFHTCRTWEWVSDAIHEFGTKTKEFEKVLPIIAGFVGLSAATELNGYVRHYSKLPDLDYLIANPTSCPVPHETPVQYALSSALSLRINEDNIKNILKFMDQMPKEMQGAMIAAAYRRDPAITDNEHFAEWAVRNQTNIF